MSPGKNHLKPLLKSLKALADGNRLRLLRLLMYQPRCVCELAAALGVAQPTVSKHLSILEEAGWLNKQRQGTFINYELISGLKPDDHRAVLLSNLRSWLQEDPELTALNRFAQNLNRQDLLKRPKKSSLGVCRMCGAKISFSED